MIEQIWIVGDFFLDRNKNYMLRGSHGTDQESADQFVMENHFEVSTITGFTGNNRGRSAISRSLNAYIEKLNTMGSTLPKWIVVFMENDLMKSINYTSFGVTKAYGMIIQYMMAQMDTAWKRCIQSDIVSSKRVNKYNWPFFIWVEPSLHYDHPDSHLRVKYIRSMYNAAQLYNNMIVLPPKQGWSYFQQDLIFNSNLSPKGIKQLWLATENSIKFADTKLMRNHGAPFQAIFQKDRMHLEAETRLTSFETQLRRRYQCLVRLHLLLLRKVLLHHTGQANLQLL